jgi:abortive infection bacteriophage resistance protein
VEPLLTLKSFKPIDEQLSLLETRGLFIEDRELAKEALIDSTYYRYNYYFKKFCDCDSCFFPGTSFPEIIKYVDFDLAT